MFTVPIGDWFRNEKAEYCQTMADNLVNRLDIFESQQVFSIIEAHCTGKVNFTREIRALISLSHWSNIG